MCFVLDKITQIQCHKTHWIEVFMNFCNALKKNNNLGTSFECVQTNIRYTHSYETNVIWLKSFFLVEARERVCGDSMCMSLHMYWSDSFTYGTRF